MSTHLPVCLLLYLTSKGHWGSQTLYRNTLEHLDRQIPLHLFASRIAHVKIQSGEERAAEAIISDLRARDFKVESAIGEWSRGTSHLSGYLTDMIKMSQLPEVNDVPYVWACDDDALLLSHRDPLERVLARMTSLISSSPDILSARFLRREDRNVNLDAAPYVQGEDLFWCRDYNLQQPLLRSRDYHLVCKVIEDHWSVATQMHIEALWRDVLAPLSRSPRKHAVWVPDYAETVHLGVENYRDICSRHNLPIYPNPI